MMLNQKDNKEQMKATYDKRHSVSPPSFKVGDKVLLQDKRVKVNSDQVLTKRPFQGPYFIADIHCGSKKNAPTLADYNYDPVQSILIIFSKLFDNDHKSCLVVKFSTSPHICCHYTL